MICNVWGLIWTDWKLGAGIICSSPHIMPGDWGCLSTATSAGAADWGACMCPLHTLWASQGWFTSPHSEWVARAGTSRWPGKSCIIFNDSAISTIGTGPLRLKRVAAPASPLMEGVSALHCKQRTQKGNRVAVTLENALCPIY